ncbi:IQ motif and SEC7 domain-containing protein 2-like [Neoarius graeffei]|uniref:IQ motif and SEC7 domain-containing protein 2-like n=1 Tax=Neoarius graeffei TaxID=443677 RepID=UPI00298BDE16|nr:IQ motif and SEC7 domain-containing protein 2-like [Neoarius graeffei]
MENATENPSKAAEYLKELNNIIKTQQELLEKQKGCIEELKRQVHELCEEDVCLKEQHQRHLATCRLQQLSSIKENVMQEERGQELLLYWSRSLAFIPCALCYVSS